MFDGIDAAIELVGTALEIGDGIAGPRETRDRRSFARVIAAGIVMLTVIGAGLLAIFATFDR